MLIARALVDGREIGGTVDGESFDPDEGDPRPLSDVQLLAPVEPGRMLIMLGGFLADDLPGRLPGATPWLFPKVSPGCVGPGGQVHYPAHLTELAAEVEVGVVIGTTGSEIAPEDAWTFVRGLTCFNDFTASEYLRSGPDFGRAKSIPGLCALGPWIRTDLTQHDLDAGLELTTRVNGRVVQRGNTSRLRYAIADVVALASRYCTLQPGDVLALGTPPPPAPVSDGDEVTIEVEGIGKLSNAVVRLAAGPPAKSYKNDNEDRSRRS